MADSKFTPDEIINMQVRVTAGESLRSIADDYDCSVNIVRYHTNAEWRKRKVAQDLARYHRNKVLKNPEPRFTEDERANMRLRYNAGETLTSIVNDYETTPETVRRIVNPEYNERAKARSRAYDKAYRQRKRQCQLSSS